MSRTLATARRLGTVTLSVGLAATGLLVLASPAPAVLGLLAPGPAACVDQRPVALVVRGSMIYVGETGSGSDNNRLVRAIDTSQPGNPEVVVAGNGTNVFSGDGGPATNAGLSFSVLGMTMDSAGNLFIMSNSRIRRVTPGPDGVVNGGSGEIITTVAGTGALGFSGDGGPATAAQFRILSSGEFDASGRLLVADRFNHRVRMIVPGTDGIIDGASDEIVTTVAGTGSAGFNQESGPATATQLNFPQDVDFDASGNPLIADDGNGRIRKLTPGPDGVRYTADDTMETLVVVGSATVGVQRIARGPSGDVFFATGGSPQFVGRFDGATVTDVVGPSFSNDSPRDGGPASAAGLLNQKDVAFDSAGNLLVADGGHLAVRKVVPGADGVFTGASDEIITTLAGFGEDPGFVNADFDGDTNTDVELYRPDDGNWYAHTSCSGDTAVGYGAPGDVPVVADYDGDNKADQAIFRPETGLWAIHNSSGGDTFVTYGIGSDIPVPADYDGDNKADIAVYRPDVGTWYVHRSSDGADVATTFGGIAGDVPVPANFDGDGNAELAIYRSGTWYVHQFSDDTDLAVDYGSAGDIPVAGDYDTDGKTDLAIFRPSTGLWAIHNSGDGSDVAVTYGGIGGDVPVAGDYDGDTRTDIAIFRPSLGAWYVHQSIDNTDAITTFGISTDVPLALPYSVRHAYF